MLSTHVASELPAHVQRPAQSTTLMVMPATTTTAMNIAITIALRPRPCLRHHLIPDLDLALTIKVMTVITDITVTSRIQIEYSRPLSEALLTLAAINQ